MSTTMLTNLFDPEVAGELLRHKLTDLIKFSPLFTVDFTLQGVPGSKIIVPSFSYSGDATIVKEGANIELSTLQMTTTDATIVKIAKAIELTDEAVLSGYGDPMTEALDQIALGLAAAVDNNALTALEGATPTSSNGSGIVEQVINALELFGEDVDEPKALIVSPADYTTLRQAGDWLPASEIAASIVISGAVGEIQGCQVIVSNKLTGKSEAFIVKPGAGRIFMKRDVNVETDRDILKKTTVISGDTHLVTYLYDNSKAIKIGGVTSQEGENNNGNATS